MSRKDRLKSVRKLAQRNEDTQSREVANQLRSLDAEEFRLKQLRGYLADYRHLLDATHKPMHVNAMQGRRKFVERLQQGINHQEGLIDRLRDQVEVQMQRWQSARSHSGALQKFSDRQAAENELRESRRDQARLDEVGTRLAYIQADEYRND